MIPNNFLEETQEDKKLEEELAKLEQPYFEKEIKLQQVSIGSDTDPNMKNIGDYWDSSQLSNFFVLLQEYQDVFAKDFKEMKVIV